MTADPITPPAIAQANGPKKILVTNKGINPPIVVAEVVITCRVDLIITSTKSSLLIGEFALDSLMCDRTTIESLIERPANPMAPTSPIKPKLACPIVKPRNAKPVHQIATLKIKIACRNEFKAETKAIIISTKNKIADEKIFD